MHLKSSPKISFPNWGYVHYALVKEMQQEYGDQYDFSVLKKKFEVLDQSLKNNEDIFSIAEKIVCNVIIDNNQHVFNSKSFLEKINHFPKWGNQFTTVYNIDKKCHEYVDPRIEDILNIKPEDFTIQALLGLDPKNKFYHPEDIRIFNRFALLGYLIYALCNPLFNAEKEYLRTKFRIKIPTYNKGNYFVAEKKTFLIKNSIHPIKFKLSKHMYLWTVIDDANKFEGVAVSFNKFGETQENYLNQLMYLFNARLLNYTPKEIVVLYYWKKCIHREEIAKQLNRAFKSDYFSTKKISDFIYKLRKKIIATYKENIIINELDEETIALINHKNALTYANKLGLLNFNTRMINLICN